MRAAQPEEGGSEMRRSEREALEMLALVCGFLLLCLLF